MRTAIFFFGTLAAAALLLLGSALAHATAFTGFPAHLSGQSFSDVSLQLGLGAAVPLRVSSLIDWRNSKNIDLVGIRQDNPACVEVRQWLPDPKRFGAPLELTPGCANNASSPPKDNREYVSATAVDINRDGLLDLVATHKYNVDIIFQQHSGAIRIQRDVLAPHFATAATTNKSRTLLPGSSVDVISYFGDCGLHDLVALDADNTMTVFKNMLNTKPMLADGNCLNGWWSTANVTFEPIAGTRIENVPAARTAAADLDGDCASEFLFARTTGNSSSSQKNEFYTTPLASSKINLAVPSNFLFSVPSDFGPPTWFDADGDGAIDAVFPVCAERGASCATAPNVYCADAALVPCVIAAGETENFTGTLTLRNINSGACPSNECCGKFASFGFESVTHGKALPGSARVSAIASQVKPHGASSSGSSPFVAPSCFMKSKDAQMMPLRLRPGDVNDDSYADLVVSSTCGPLVLYNHQPSPGGFRPSLFVTAQTTTVQGEAGASDLALLSNNEGALPFFFDVDDDGRLDVLVMRHGNYTACLQASKPLSQCGSGVFAFWHRNSDERTNYFITAATLNGATALPNAAWGAIQLGATVRFQHLNIDNDVHTSGGTQVPTTAYFALALPRPHFGIGLTFASVMNFASGMNVNGRSNENSWPSVYLTPNSQILCVPFPITDPSQWKLRLYLLGNWDLRLVLIAWLISLTVIGIPILVLGIREVREDRRSFGLA